ncbi:MAG: class I SAM-dependent methyltransferase [Bdellovibrionota bacterium]
MNKYLVRPWHLFRRGSYFRKYLAESAQGGSAPRLHVGCGNRPISGWCNIDVAHLTDEVQYVDALKTLPFDDNSFQYVFTEHFIEHLSFEDGLKFFGEAHRILRPGGVLRTATPDLGFLTQVYAKSATTSQRYVDYTVQQFAPEKPRSAVTSINLMFYGWGHRHIYDAAYLQEVLKRIGFEKFKVMKPGSSELADLQGLEQHGKSVPPDINEMETFVLEATKI